MIDTIVELSPELMGVSSLNAYIRHISSARIAMFCSHIGQALVVEGATINRTLTGSEAEYAGDDHNIKFPCKAIVLKTIHRFPKTLAEEPVNLNTLSAVIYENADSPKREIGVLLIDNHHCIHQHFGFNYVFTEHASRLLPNQHFEKGTVIAHSPIVKMSNNKPIGYAYGIEAQVAMMSIPSIIEDGVVISKGFANRLKTKGYGVRTVSWGPGSIPLNIYGDPNNPEEYKPFPHIGEYVKENGVLFATRNYEESLAVATMSRKALSKLDYFDKPTQAIPGARVVDVVVYKGNKNKTFLPGEMTSQIRYYYDKTYNFYKNIVDEYYRLKRLYGDGLLLDPKFTNLVTKAEIFIKMGQNTHLTPVYQSRPVEEWLIDIVFEYDIVPNIGFKLTGLHGDKGVVVDIWPDEDMPTDFTGARADIITDFDSTIKRMNPSRTYEPYINASARFLSMQIEEDLYSGSPIQPLWDKITDFYSIVTPLMLDDLNNLYKDESGKRRHLENIAMNGIYKYQPPDNPVDYADAIYELSQKYPAPLGSVTYRGRKGQWVKTKHPVLIGGMYILLLEKTGNTWQSVSSAKQQHYGIPAKINNSDKYSSPGRHQAVRIFGESEVRLIAAICGGDITADMLDQTNNPIVHRHVTETILTADNPMAIERIVDREKMPVGNGRILTLVKHVLECAGVKFVRGNYANV